MDIILECKSNFNTKGNESKFCYLLIYKTIYETEFQFNIAWNISIFLINICLNINIYIYIQKMNKYFFYQKIHDVCYHFNYRRRFRRRKITNNNKNHM